MGRTRHPIDKHWYILLNSRVIVGAQSHWLAAKSFDMKTPDDFFDKRECVKVHRRTRNPKAALWFLTKREAERYIKTMDQPGYTLSPIEIERYADPKRPKKVMYRTEFGVVTAKEGQLILFPGERIDDRSHA
jgi:hypothetical protein